MKDRSEVLLKKITESVFETSSSEWAPSLRTSKALWELQSERAFDGSGPPLSISGVLVGLLRLPRLVPGVIWIACCICTIPLRFSNFSSGFLTKCDLFWKQPEKGPWRRHRSQRSHWRHIQFIRLNTVVCLICLIYVLVAFIRSCP